MGFDIKDLALLKAAASNMAALIEACRPRGPFYSHDKDLTNAVIRNAQGAGDEPGASAEGRGRPAPQAQRAEALDGAAARDAPGP